MIRLSKRLAATYLPVRSRPAYSAGTFPVADRRSRDRRRLVGLADIRERVNGSKRRR